MVRTGKNWLFHGRQCIGVFSGVISWDGRGEIVQTNYVGVGNVKRDAPATVDALRSRGDAIIVQDGDLRARRDSESDDAVTCPSGVLDVEADLGAGLDAPGLAGAGGFGVHEADEAVAVLLETMAKEKIVIGRVTELGWGVVAAGKREVVLAVAGEGHNSRVVDGESGGGEVTHDVEDVSLQGAVV